MLKILLWLLRNYDRELYIISFECPVCQKRVNKRGAFSLTNKHTGIVESVHEGCLKEYLYKNTSNQDAEFLYKILMEKDETIVKKK